jgi:hypothetical protein
MTTTTTNNNHYEDNKSYDPSEYFFPLPYDYLQRSHTWKYLKQHRLFYFGSDTIPDDILEACHKPTLTSILGGKAFIPPNHFQGFLKAAARDQMDNHVISWNQQAYEVMGGSRLIIDIDCKQCVSDSVMQQLIYILRETLQEYFPQYETQSLPPIFVAKTEPTLKIKRSGTFLAEGIHIIVHLTEKFEHLKQIVYGYRLRLEKHQMDMSKMEVDTSIYKSMERVSVLRMIYSCKKQDCMVCNNDYGRRMSCDFCKRNGFVIPKSSYKPYGMMHSDGKMSPFQFQNMEEVFRIYSIWVEDIKKESRTDYKQPECDPCYRLAEKDYKDTTLMKLAAPLKKKTMDGSVQEVSYAQLDSRHINTYQAVSNMISLLQYPNKDGQLAYCWPNAEVEKILHREKAPVLITLKKQIGSNYCNYIKQCHTTNNIYFIVLKQKSQLKQLCHNSACHTKMQDNPILFTIPKDVMHAIFDSLPNQKPLKKTTHFIPHLDMFDLA